MNDNDRFHRDDPDRGYPRRNMSEGLRNDDPLGRASRARQTRAVP